jgi:hypothetical protein
MGVQDVPSHGGEGAQVNAYVNGAHGPELVLKLSQPSTKGGEMKKYAMIGYYPSDVGGGVYAVGNEGVTVAEAKEHAAKEGLELFQVFPLQGQESGPH